MITIILYFNDIYLPCIFYIFIYECSKIIIELRLYNNVVYGVTHKGMVEQELRIYNYRVKKLFFRDFQHIHLNV